MVATPRGARRDAVQGIANVEGTMQRALRALEEHAKLPKHAQ